MFHVLSTAYYFLKNNVRLPTATYHTPLVEFPSVRSGVVRVADLFAGIHPNHVGVALLFVCVCVFLYIKIKYPFWNGQPVYHTYDFWRAWSISPSIIYQLPLKTKYTEKRGLITTRPFAEYSRDQIGEILEHLQCHYIRSDRIIYNLEEREFASFMSGGEETPYLTVYNHIQYDANGGSRAPSAPQWTDLVASPQTRHIVKGCVVSRHVDIHFVYKTGAVAAFPAYYQDFFCVNREKSADAQFQRQLFDTHEYNIRVRNPDVKVSLFKKEVALADGVVPLLKYFSYTYFLNIPPFRRLPPEYVLSRISKGNADALYDYWGGLKRAQTEQSVVLFHCFVLPPVANIVSLMASKNMWVYCLKYKDIIYAMYFVRNEHTNYEELDDVRGNGGNTLHLVASANNSPDMDVFVRGFSMCLGEILKENPHFKMLMMDGVGHNQILISHWEKSREPVFAVPSAYYLFNMVVPQSPLDVSKCFILI